MARKVYFILLDSGGRKIRKIGISRLSFLGIVALVTTTCICIGFGVYQFIAIRDITKEKTKLEKKLVDRSEEVLQQRKQITMFAEDLNSLKDRLLELDDFEKKIRSVASLDGKGDVNDTRQNVFGVGGSYPEEGPGRTDEAQRNDTVLKEMHSEVGQLKETSESHRKKLEDLYRDLKRKNNILAHTPSVIPAEGYISSAFGYRRSPFTGEREFHQGIDIANRRGTPILAPAAGTVAYEGDSTSFGKLLVIDHGFGLVTRYGHISRFLKKAGTEVKRGDEIALMGNSGRSTGTHLHYEVRLNGVPVNPAKYISSRQ